MTDVTLTQVALFLAAAVVAAPLAKLLRIGNVLGYLLVGVLIGPFGLGFVYSIYEVTSVLHFAEFGVVLLLFLIGLELRPQPPLGHARSHLRPWRRPSRHHCRPPCRHRPGPWPCLAHGTVRRSCPLLVVHRLRPSGARGEGRAGPAPRPHGVRRAAVPGPGGDPADRAYAPVRRHGGKSRADGDPLRAEGDRHHPAGGVRRPLRARRPDPHRRAHAGEGGDDGLRVADRGRRDAGDGARGPFGVAGGVHRRRSARRFRLSPRDRGRYRAVRGPAARSVLHRRRHVAQPQADGREPLPGRGDRLRPAGGEERRALPARPPRRDWSPGRHVAWRSPSPRAASSPSCCSRPASMPACSTSPSPTCCRSPSRCRWRQRRCCC